MCTSGLSIDGFTLRKVWAEIKVMKVNEPRMIKIHGDSVGVGQKPDRQLDENEFANKNNTNGDVEAIRAQPNVYLRAINFAAGKENIAAFQVANQNAE